MGRERGPADRHAPPAGTTDPGSASAPDASDAQLVAAVRRGSERAAREIVTRYERAVYNLIARLVRDPGLAEDLAQDVFVKVFTKLASFDPRFKFSNWILKIAHNTAIDALRVRRVPTVFLDPAVGPDLDDLPAPHSVTEGPVASLERAGLAAAVDEALGLLRADYRHLIVLRYHEDLGYEEIVEITGLPLGTVKTFLHRARAELGAILTRMGWAPEKKT